MMRYLFLFLLLGGVIEYLPAQKSKRWFNKFCYKNELGHCKEDCDGNKECLRECKQKAKFNCKHNQEGLAYIKSFLAGPTPSDDPKDYLVDTSKNYDIEVSDPVWIVPKIKMPEGVELNRSNANVGIEIFDHRLFVSFRSAKNHFANDETKLFIISTEDGVNWEKEAEVFLGADMREPILRAFNDTLFFYFFEAGTRWRHFEPKYTLSMKRLGLSNWTEPKPMTKEAEVFWDIKVRNNKLYASTYISPRNGDLKRLLLKVSDDGRNFKSVNSFNGICTNCNLKEMAFEFEESGKVWAACRNGAGDSTGHGSMVITSHLNHLAEWTFKDKSDPFYLASARMIRHGEELYVLARNGPLTAKYGTFFNGEEGKLCNNLKQLKYSLSPQRTSVFKLDKENKKLIPVKDLDGAGDNAFPSVIRLSAHKFLVANYTSPPHKKKRSWLRGQVGKTGVYISLLEFKEK